MSTDHLADGAPFVDFGALHALVVDDSPGIRNALRLTLSNMGMIHVQLVANAAEAIFQVKSKSYDFILCDFNLGEGRDGQQLLEVLRHGNLISLETVFMMVTAESFYEKVVAAAELTPDDYMIKPFSAEVLCNRLASILMRKRAFREIYRHFSAQNLEAAVAGCEVLISAQPRYRIDALRFKGDLLLTLGRYADAEALYQEVIAMRPIPWARLGLARALHLQKKDDPAEACAGQKTPLPLRQRQRLRQPVPRAAGAGRRQGRCGGTAAACRAVRRASWSWPSPRASCTAVPAISAKRRGRSMKRQRCAPPASGATRS